MMGTDELRPAVVVRRVAGSAPQATARAHGAPLPWGCSAVVA